MNHIISNNILPNVKKNKASSTANKLPKPAPKANPDLNSINLIKELCKSFPACFDISAFVKSQKIKIKSGKVLVVEKSVKSNTFVKKLVRSRTFDDKEFITDDVYFEDCRNEIYLCSTLKNKYIIEPNEILYFENEFYLIFELGDCTLFELVEKVALDKNQIKNLLTQILVAVQYMHKQEVSHQDIKLENIVLFGELLKIIDFGSAKLKNQEDRRIIGSEPYMAPELFEVEIHNGPKLDIWSVGIISIALITRKFPWELATFDDIEYGEFCVDRKNKLDEILKPFLKGDIKDCVIDFISICLDPDFDSRASIDELINHPYILK